MKITKTSLDDTRVRIDAVASIEEVDSAFQTLSEKAEEDKSGSLASQVAEFLIPFALNKTGILPAFPPHASFTIEPEQGKEFSFEIEVYIKPTYTLSSYETVSISIPKVSVEDFEIDQQLAEIVESYAEYIADKPRALELGDSVLMTMESFDAGRPIPELTIEKRTYISGTQMMPSGFDENIIGMEPGQTKKFQITGPIIDEAGKQAEKTVDCEVSILEIQKKIIPSLNDAWVKETVPGFENVAQLREGVRQHIIDTREQELSEMKRQAAVTELCARFEGDIAQEVHEENKKALLANITTQLEIQGVAMDWFVKQNGGEESFDVALSMQTSQSLIEGYALDALFLQKNMSIDEADIIEACKTINPDEPAAVKEQMEKNGYEFALRETASRIKANTWLVDTAKITESKA